MVNNTIWRAWNYIVHGCSDKCLNCLDILKYGQTLLHVMYANLVEEDGHSWSAAKTIYTKVSFMD